MTTLPVAFGRLKDAWIRTVNHSGDGTTDQVVDVKLWGKTRAFKLAAREGCCPDRTDVTTGEELPAKRDTAMLKARTPTTE